MRDGITQWYAGAHHGLVWSHGLALVEGSTDLGAIAELWRSEPAALGDFLDSLRRLNGDDFRELPLFAVAVRAGAGWHTAMRGGLGVEVGDGHNVTAVEPSGGPWTERRFRRIRGFRLGSTVDAAQADAGWRPIRSAIVPAGALGWAETAPEPGPATAPATRADRAAVEPDDQARPFAHLWGVSLVPDRYAGTPADAAPAPEPAAAPGRASAVVVPPPPRTTPGDHDGHTVLAGRPPATSGAGRPAPGVPTPETGQVVGLRCPRQHPNPPHRSECRICGAPLAGTPVALARPPLGRAVFPDGTRIDLGRRIILGRRPQGNRLQGTELPQLVPLPFDHISGNHVELLLEEWTVLAHDLHSTNGTFLQRAGEPMIRLPERPVPLRSGDVLDLGHGVRITLEELP